MDPQPKKSTPQNTMTEVMACVIDLTKLLGSYYVERLKLACFGIGHDKDRLEEIGDQFVDVFKCLEERLPEAETVAFTCHILETLGYKRTEKLRRSVEEMPGYDFRAEYPKVDCIFTTLEFLSDLKKNDFSIVRSCVCSSTKQTTDHVENRIDLVYILFSENLVTEDNLEYIYSLAEKFNRTRFFDEYKKRLLQSRAYEVMKDGAVCKKNNSVTCTPSRHDSLEKNLKVPEPCTGDSESEEAASSYQSGGTFAAVSENPLPPTSETVTELSTDRTDVTAPYGTDCHSEVGGVKNEHQHGLVVNEIQHVPAETDDVLQNKPDITELYSMMMQPAEGDSVAVKWWEIGEELKVPKEYLDLLQTKKRTYSFKLEEILNKWDEIECSPVTWDDIIQVLLKLKFVETARRVKEHLNKADS